MRVNHHDNVLSHHVALASEIASAFFAQRVAENTTTGAESAALAHVSQKTTTAQNHVSQKADLAANTVTRA